MTPQVSLSDNTNLVKQHLLVVAGMSRGGTTYLYHHLPRHPQIAMTAQKEMCYFGLNYDRGMEWWERQLPALQPDQWMLDICGLYFTEYEKAIPRILEFAPETHVVLSLRSPKEWIFSIYEHYSSVWNTPPFEEFLRGCTWNRDGRDVPLQFCDRRIERGVQAFAQAFRDRLLLLDFRLLQSDPLQTLREIENFINVEKFFDESNVERRKYNQRGNSAARRLHLISSIPGARSLNRWLPSSLRSGIRRIFERGDSSSESSQTKKLAEYTDEQLKLVDEIMSPDQAFYDQLFEGRSAVRGSEIATST